MRDPLDVADPKERRRIIVTVIMFGVGVLLMLAVRPSLLNIVLIVAGFTLVIMLHEFGHYWTARKTGMKATEFFVGFGPRIWSFRKGETEYGLKAIPLGGYVRIIGMNNVEEVPPEDEPRTYRAATTPRKLIVILAGVTVNLILAMLCITTLFLVKGQPSLRTSTPLVGIVSVDSPAEAAGFKSGDRIVSVNGEAIDNFDQVPPIIRANPDKPLTVVVTRDGTEQTLTVTPRVEKDGVAMIGIGRGADIYYKQYSVPGAVGASFVWFGESTQRMVAGIGKLVTPSYLTQYFNTVKEGDAENPERPRSVVGIGRETSRAMDRDPWALVEMLAVLNLFLAIFNLIPLLPFDGGHAVIAAYEGVASKVRHRKVVVDYNRMTPIAMGVLVILLVLAVPAIVLDVSQFFG